MLLAIDIGNTHTVIGLFDEDNLIASWRMGTPRYKYETADEIGALIINFLNNSGYGSTDVTDIAISSVVPRALEEIKKMSSKYFNADPMVINSDMNIGMEILYDYPNEIGADRLANSIAAIKIYGTPAIIVDSGTATTFDIVSSNGSYLGGVITPGLEISSEALFNTAAKLSKVDLTWPESIIGKNTYDGIRAGILYGFLGQVDYIIEEIIRSLKKQDLSFNPKVIATGGLSFLLESRSRFIKIYDNDLTLRGIRILHKMNDSKENKSSG